MNDDNSTTNIDDIESDATSTCEVTELRDGGVIRHWPHFFDPILASDIYAALRDSVPWEQMRFRGSPEPRLTAWMGDRAYRYSGVTRKPAPTLDLVGKLITKTEQVVFVNGAQHFGGVLLNYYRNGRDRIGLHSDNEPELVPGAPIASLSFGATRRFVLRHQRSSEKVELPLASGSLLLMEGTTQRFWKHEVPAEARCLEGRINLTMRCHVVATR